MGTHCAKLESQKDNLCKRVYKVLRTHEGTWIRNVELGRRALCQVAVSTVVSQVRRQLQAGETIECERRRAANGRMLTGYVYRRA